MTATLSGAEVSTFAVLAEDGSSAGTGFAVPILASHAPGTFVLTAAHVLPARAKEGAKVRLASADGSIVSGRVLLRPEIAERAIDAALIYSDECSVLSLRCADRLARGSVVLRGCSGGVRTRWGNFPGAVLGREPAEPSEVLDVQLADLGLIVPPDDPLEGGYKANPEFLVLRGLSGGPILVHASNEPVAIGHVVGRAPSGLVSRVHGVPISVTAKYLGEEGHFLAYQRQAQGSIDIVGRRLIGELFSEAVASPEREQRLWETISASFYQGDPLDALLEDISTRPIAYGVRDPLALAFIQYFAARFAIKRGDAEQGLSLLGQVRRQEDLHGNVSYERLKAVIELRVATEQATVHPSGVLLERFKLARERLARVVGDADWYFAYEAASCEGRVATKLLRPTVLAEASGAREAAQRLADEQAELIGAFPSVLLDKQEVVEIAVAVLLALTDPTGGSENDCLSSLAERGRRAALQRTNNIFLTQMAIVEAASMWRRGDTKDALIRAGVVGAVLQHLGISTTHEGVSDVIAHIRRQAPPVEAALLSGWQAQARGVLRKPVVDRTALEAATWAHNALGVFSPADVLAGPW